MTSRSYSRLVLGTAQLGLPYGIANQTGQPDQKIATTIIQEAWENGIREFDTAQGYGTSEEALGKALYELEISNEAKIITKFHPNLDHLDASVLSNALNQSLERLRISSLFGIMLHREEMLYFWHKGLGKILQGFVLTGKVEKIGISVYSPEKAIEALNTDGIDLIQLPTNILDRRFEDIGVFYLADEKGKTIYIRSIFLQGLILMKSCGIPGKMAFAQPIIEKIESLSDDIGLSRQEIAAGYIKFAMPNALVIFGVENPDQVIENIDAWKIDMPESLGKKVRELFADVDERILNPSLWLC